MKICIDARLNILCQSGVIDQDIGQGLDQVINRLEHFWQLPVHGDQGVMAITHMANALMRTRRGEEIAALDPAILAEIVQSKEIHYIRGNKSGFIGLFFIKTGRK